MKIENIIAGITGIAATVCIFLLLYFMIIDKLAYTVGFVDGMKAGAEQAFQNDIQDAYNQGRRDTLRECEHPTVPPSAHGY